MKNIGKRFAALCLTAALALTNVGNSSNLAYAAGGERVDFIIKGSDFADAIENMIESKAQPVTEADLNFTDGKLEKYHRLFFENQGALYEFYPDFDGPDMEAEIRTFIRLPEDVDDAYTLTGEEEIIILYVNNGENTVAFSTVFDLPEGGEKRTKRVSVKSYGQAFGDNRIDYGASVKPSDSPQGTEQAGNGVETGKPQETGDAVETGSAGAAEDAGKNADAVETGSAGVTEDAGENADAVETGSAGATEDAGENADAVETGSTRETEEAAQTGDAGEAGNAGENEDAVETGDARETERITQSERKESSSEKNEEMGTEKTGEPVAVRSYHEAPKLTVKQESVESNGEAQPSSDRKSGAEHMDTVDEIKASEPERSISDTANPETAEPGAVNPGAAKPGETEPGTAEPDAGNPGAAKPGETEPDTANPGTTNPDTTNPGTTNPETANPGTTNPDTTEPVITNPDTTNPDTTESGTADPGATDPGTTVPETTEPNSTVPAAPLSTPSEPEGTETPPMEPENQESETTSIGYGDLVGMGGCSTAKAYITTLGKLKVLEDVEGFQVTYEITPGSKGVIQKGPRSVEEGEDLTFGVKTKDGYMVESASANGNALEAQRVESGTAWYFLEDIEEDQKIEITLSEQGLSPEFLRTFQMSDGMDVTIYAAPGVLPWGTSATVEIVTDQVEDVIKEKGAEQGQVIVAAPSYDINLWLGDEKLDSEEWNSNGQVEVSFSGSLMERLSREAEAAQVLWVKEQGDSVEVMEDSHREIPDGQAIDGLSCATSHFTTFSAAYLTRDTDAVREFDIQGDGLMDAGYPKLTVCDKNNQELDVVETSGEDGITRITLKDGTPLPRDIKTWFEISYAMENSGDSSLAEYLVKAGDRFTYRYPANILYDAVSFDVLDTSGTVIGRAGIKKDGLINIDITKSQVGQRFKGTAGVRGSIDFTGDNKDKTEIVIHCGDVDKTLVFAPAPVVQKHSVSVKKSHNNDRWADTGQERNGDVRYSPMGIPEAVRFHVTIEAGKNNTSDLTDIQVTDTFSNNKKGKVTFDTEAGITLDFISEGSSIAKAEFDAPAGGSGTNMLIKLTDRDGGPASMKPGEKAELSYWMKILPQAWGSSAKTENEGKKVNASLNVSFDNKVTVKSSEGASGSADSTFSHTAAVVSKSGITHYNEKIDGEGEVIPVFIEYHVYVNPDCINLTGWTVKDTLDSNQKDQEGQEYLGQVTITAYDKSGDKGQVMGTWTIDTDKETNSGKSKTWEWEIPAPGNYYYDFKYYTTVNEPKGSNLNNEIQMIAPAGSGFPGTGGGTQVGFLYNTYTLSKKNLSSDMKENSQEPVTQNKAGVIGWGDEFGTIRWESVLTPYSNGVTDSETAVIPEDALYRDVLTVITWNSGEIKKYLDKHTFGSLDQFKSGFTLTDGNGTAIGPDEGIYDLAFDTNLGNREFTVKFNEAVRGPVTIAYNSYVEKEAFADFGRNGADNLRFKNTANLTIQGSTWTRWASQPYYVEDYLSKSVSKTDAKKGEVVWTLKINKGYGSGNAPQDLSKFKEVYIQEMIPKGMVLERIKFKNMNYTLTETAGDYTVEMCDGSQMVTIYLNQIAKNFNGYKLGNHINLDVTTKITDPAVKTFVNKAQMFIDGTSLYQVSASTNMNNGFLEKGMEYSGSTAPYAVYTILVNQPGADISSSTLTIKDTLGNDKMIYLPDSFQVSNAETSEVIREAVINVGDRSFEISNLPDEKPIRIVYKVMLNGAVGSTINTKNTAQLYYSSQEPIGDTVEEAVRIVKPWATGGGDFSVKIYKVDQSGRPLEGAEFTLYRAAGVDDDHMEPLGIYKPVKEEQGRSCSVLIEGLKKGQLYYLDETVVPQGYQKAEGRYFIIPDEAGARDYPEGVLVVENTGIPFIFENARSLGSLKITKNVTGEDVSQQGEEGFYFTIWDGTRYYNEKGESLEGVRQVILLHYVPDGRDNSLVIPLPTGTYTVTEAADAEGNPIDGGNFSYEVRVNGRDGNTEEVPVAAGQQAEVVFDNHVPDKKTPEGGTDPSGGGTQPSGGGSGGTGGSGGNSGRYNPSGGPGETVNIEPEQIPMAQWPDDPAQIMILDEDVPLAPLPKTGEGPRSYYLMAVISSLLSGLYIALHGRKRES